MLQRALQVTLPHLAPEILGVRKAHQARALFSALADHCLLILRRLGEFFATGGPMS
jgi:hypothetical protein